MSKKCITQKFYTLLLALLIFSCGGIINTEPEDSKQTNTAPNAFFSVNPSSGSIVTTFSFDASSCFDNEDQTSALQVHWDWETDGTWDTNYSRNKTATHICATVGTKIISLEVKDTGGLTNTTTKQISVTGEHGGETGTVTDIDGNVYKTVKIGDQWWMAENLKVSRYQNGEAIPNRTNYVAWENYSWGAYCAYDSTESYADAYGYLYNWYAIDDDRKIAPTGWHVPSDEEWKELEMYLGMSRSEAEDTGERGIDEGGKMKEAGTAHWRSPNTGATNVSGLSALPGGYRRYNGYYNYLGTHANFWCSSEHYSSHAWRRTLIYESSGVYRDDGLKHSGFSVRCVRD